MGDASTAIGIIRPMGLGKVRHLNTIWLWVQEKETSHELQNRKVKGSNNSDYICSPRRLTTTVSCDTRKPWDMSSCLGKIPSH